MKKNIISNFFYQTAYQLTLMFLPIFTIPIVSHALGVEGIGLYNYITSIASYFILVAGLGLANYGIREIATVKNDKKKLSEKFWNLELFNVLIATAVVALYIIFLTIVPNKLFFMIAGLSVLSTLFDISWFYYGIEDFKEITIVNILVKLFSFVLILIFINAEKDLWKYFLIQNGSILLSNLSLWFFLRNKLVWIKPTIRKSLSHFKPALNYFIGKASITIYTTLNKTLLGLLATTVAVGLYTNSLQLITMFVALIGTLDTVLLPHLTGIFSNSSKEKMIPIIEKTIDFQLFFSIPLMFGLILTNAKMIPWFFGNDFIYLNYTVPVLAPLVIIIPLGTSIVRQYLIPMNEIKKFNISVIIAAIIGLLTNIILIPLIGIWGAIVSILLSEIVVTGIRLSHLLRTSDFRFSYKKLGIYFISGYLMYFIVNYITFNWKENITTTILQAIMGIFLYFVFTIILKENLVLNYIKDSRSKKER